MLQFDKYSYVVLLHSSIIITGSYCIIFLCSWSICKYLSQLQSASHVDHHTLEIQKQVTRILIFQAIIPLITFCFPISVMCITIIFQISVPEYLSTLFGLILVYVPLGNVLSMFFFVKVYKTFGIQFLKAIIREMFRCYNLLMPPNNTAPNPITVIMPSIHTPNTNNKDEFYINYLVKEYAFMKENTTQ